MQEKKQSETELLKYQTNIAEQTNANLTPNEPRTIETAEQTERPEIRFFTDPKTVRKLTQAAVVRFQIIFTALFCLLYKAAEAFTPELYVNINTYLERLFRW